MAIAKLSIDLEARLAGLQAGLDKAGLLAERQAKRIEGAFSGIARVGSALGATLGGAFAVGGLTAFVRSTIAGLDALNDFADATGTSIELASALEDVAARTGTSFDTVQTSVLRLNKVLSDAKPGSEAAETLKLIGLNAEELKRLDPAEALRRTAVALAQFADDGNKARVIQELFGKSVAQVAPLLKDLAESGELNATVTTEQAKAAEAFNIQLFNLQKNVVDVARSTVGQLVPALNQFFDAVAGRGVGGSTSISDLLVVPLQAVSVLGANVAFVFKGIGTEIGGIAAQAAAFLSGDFSGARTIGEFMREDAKAARAEFDQLEKRLMSIGRVLPQASYSNEGRTGGRPVIGTVTPNAGGNGRLAGASRGAAPFVGPMLDDASLDAIKALEGTDIARISALRDQLQRLVAIRGGSSDTAGVDEALQNTVEQLAKLDPAAKAAARAADEFNAILSQTPSGQFAAVLKQIDLINERLPDTADNAAQRAEAFRVVTARLGTGTVEQIEKISTFADQAGRNIQDALGSSLEEVLRGNFESIGQIWTDLLVRMAAQAAAAQLNNALFGNLFGGTGTGSGFIGGAVSSLFGGFFADGGRLGAGKVGIAGERGPELISGPATITPIVAGSGGSSVTIINHINGDVSPGTVRLVEGAMARFEAKIQRSMRTGGAYAGAY
jgi:hypothetical protein